MTNRPMPVHSFGMEAVKEMVTATRQKTSARKLVFYLAQQDKNLRTAQLSSQEHLPVKHGGASLNSIQLIVVSNIMVLYYNCHLYMEKLHLYLGKIP